MCLLYAYLFYLFIYLCFIETLFLFYKNTFIHQGCFKLTKSDSKYIYIVTENVHSFAVSQSTKILSSTTVFSINNNNQKCFLSSKSAY